MGTSATHGTMTTTTTRQHNGVLHLTVACACGEAETFAAYTTTTARLWHGRHHAAVYGPCTGSPMGHKFGAGEGGLCVRCHTTRA